MDKICIICREPKEKFNEEHVFPAAIGGAFTIYSVCEDCNNKLGKSIDSPLSNHKWILHFRKLFNIRRITRQGVREIKNPFKGTTQKDADGNEYFVEYNERGPEAIMRPTYEQLHINKDGAFVGKMTISEKLFKNDEQAKEMFAKKVGIKPEDISRIEKEINTQKSFNLTLTDISGPIVFGFLKIAYEFAATLIPKYISDPFAEKFSQILLGNGDEHKSLLLADPSVKDEFMNSFLSIQGLLAGHHVAMLKTIKGKGLFCGVKVFTIPFIIRLSDKEDYFNGEKIFVINDSITQTYGIEIPLRVSQFKIAIDVVGLNRKNSRICKRFREGEFKTAKGHIPIFNKSGKLIYKHMEELANQFVIPNNFFDFTNKKAEVPVPYNSGQYYVKSFKNNMFVPVKQVIYCFEGMY